MGEEELEQALTSAVTCCILASAGPQRSRVLANLCKDERCARLPVFPFLEKVYLERILRRQEVRGFRALRVHCPVSMMTCKTACAVELFTDIFSYDTYPPAQQGSCARALRQHTYTSEGAHPA